MPGNHGFEHLRLLLRRSGDARGRGGGEDAQATIDNRAKPAEHSRVLVDGVAGIADRWKRENQERVDGRLPPVPAGKSFLLQVDPRLELDELRDKFSFEIVSEQADGFVLVATEDLDLEEFAVLARKFATLAHGAGVVASVHRLFDDDGQLERLRKILSDSLLRHWPDLRDEEVLVVDLGIACVGTGEIPDQPKSKLPRNDVRRMRRQKKWEQRREAAFRAWDELRVEREADLLAFLGAHHAETLKVSDDAGLTAKLPDSLTLRVKLSGRALRDVAFNYPFVFEILEPDDIALQRTDSAPAVGDPPAAPLAPLATAPTVCVIDSGIQEQHALLAPAIDTASSRCFLPGRPVNEVGDYVASGGHGTRVAGAVLYGEEVARSGQPQLPFWILNARVLDDGNKIPIELFPPKLIELVVEHCQRDGRMTRIFNHSVAANGPCRTVHMSAWAAAIDQVTDRCDILFVQSSGNIQDPVLPNPAMPSIRDHLLAGREYPGYLTEPASRISNPAQSLQALTVGSVAYGAVSAGDWKSFAAIVGEPSAFSRSGLGIWDVIKPEVVEFGGDAVRDSGSPPTVVNGGPLGSACPELVRSTMVAPGPAFDRDAVGTSFAAPKVARIAAMVQAALPAEPALLYRALVVQSARWPDWAERLLAELRAITGQSKKAKARKEALREKIKSVVRCLGYGIPDGERASTNSDFRTTLVTHGVVPIKARQCDVYQVPIPAILRRPGNDFDVRIDVTLSFVASPRRTRRTLRHYLSTWVSWRGSNLTDTPDAFLQRVLKDLEATKTSIKNRGLPWTLQDKAKDGLVRGVRRGSGTVQKDWAVVKSADLPESFCIAVVGHQGWSHDPEAKARYCLAVTIDIEGQEIAIYDPMRVEVEELAAQIEARIDEARIRVDG